MNHIFQDQIKEGWMVVYMDDILIFSSDLETHHYHTHIIFETMKEKHLFLKPAKCSFDKEEINFLGMIIKHGIVAMDPAKLKGITEWSTPQKL